MRIKKIINNNVILSENNDKTEVILMGRGIAFAKKIGEDISESSIDKIFTLESKEEVYRFSKLLSEISLEYFAFVEEIVTQGREIIKKKLNNYIYITLADHIATLKERAEIGAYLDNSMLWDIKRLYRDEFKIGLWAVSHINEKLHAHYDENEAATIAMHFVTASIESDFGTTANITKTISEILNIVKYHFKIEYDEESLTFYRFVTHLRFFTQRIFSGNSLTGMDDLELYALIKHKYSDVYDCTRKIKDFLEKLYGYALSDEESLYLTIHIAKLVRESRQL